MGYCFTFLQHHDCRIVWPIGYMLHVRKPTSSWKYGGLRDLGFSFILMLAAKLEGAPMSWAATFAIPWVLMGVLILLTLVVSDSIPRACERCGRVGYEL